MKRRPLPSRRPVNYSRRRAATLALVYLLITIHILHWKIAGRTLAPLELNEVMYTLELGILTAGFIFMALAVLATMIFGRFFCSWGCHILALEDLCAWILGQLRIRPKPVRSRVLPWVPVIAMLYMFVWPQAARLAAGEPMPALHVRADAQGWASFVTTNFWRNLPDPGITLLTFAVCGFVIVYFLGARAFCTYACPYGAVFSLADRIAPGRIVARKDCSQCGICTATCQSRVRVHEELMEFGRVVNPACLKDLDCVAACPNGALGYGLALPALFEPSKSSRLRSKPYDFTWPEDLLIAAVFLASLFIFRGLYYSVPFLMTLAIGGILGYAAVLVTRLLYLNHVKLNNFQLKIGGRLTRTGRAFVAASTFAALFTLHSAFIRYHEFQGHRHFQVATDAHSHGAADAHAHATMALGHLDFCDTWGLFHPAELSHRLATLCTTVGMRLAEQGDLNGAIDHLRKACRVEPGLASHHYNLGVLLAQTGQEQPALAEYKLAVALDPSDPDIHNNLGYLLTRRGELDRASAHFRAAIDLKPDFAHPHFNLGRILQAQGRHVEAGKHFDLAARLDPLYREVLSMPLQNSTPQIDNNRSQLTEGASP